MARDRAEGAVVNINTNQLLWLTGLNQVLWINLTGKIEALYELAVYLTPSWSTIVGFMWISMAFFWACHSCVVRSVFLLLFRRTVHYIEICSIIMHHLAHVSPFSHNAYRFQTGLNLGLETWNVGSFFLFSRKTHPEQSCDIFKKANKSKPSTFLRRGENAGALVRHSMEIWALLRNISVLSFYSLCEGCSFNLDEFHSACCTEGR